MNWHGRYKQRVKKRIFRQRKTPNTNDIVCFIQKGKKIEQLEHNAKAEKTGSGKGCSCCSSFQNLTNINRKLTKTQKLPLWLKT